MTTYKGSGWFVANGPIIEKVGWDIHTTNCMSSFVFHNKHYHDCKILRDFRLSNSLGVFSSSWLLLRHFAKEDSSK